MKCTKIIAAAILFLFVVSACAKYEEGSNFSLISAKKRLENTWNLTKYEVNGNDETSNSPGLEVIFYKDETYKRTFTYGFAVSDVGTWNFSNNKKYVTLKKSDGSIETYHILQLKNNDLKVERHDTDGAVYRYTFKGK